MDGGIQERVEALRQEIAEIQRLNLDYFQAERRDATAMSDYETARTIQTYEAPAMQHQQGTVRC